MPFSIVRNDITNMDVDAIVNASNTIPTVQAGVEAAIHKKAGPLLLRAREKIGFLRRGTAAVTPGFELKAKYVIHTGTPVWHDGAQGEMELLRQVYDVCLNLAVKKGCRSIAFPLLSSGNHGFPKSKALQAAIGAFSDFLMEHEIEIYLVVFGEESVKLSEKLFSSVAQYIDENYVAEYEKELYGDLIEEDARVLYQRRRRMEERDDFMAAPYAPPPSQAAPSEEEVCKPAPFSPPPGKEQQHRPYMSAPSVGAAHRPNHSSPAAKARFRMPHMPVPQLSKPSAKSAVSLDEFLKAKDAGFTETLLSLIEKSGQKNSTIYKKANISKQLFSKIINDPEAKPSKATAIALALALELDVEETKDLIGRAGYALTNSSTFDLIIRYFIEHRQYNVIEINIALYEFDQSLLGG